MTNKQCPICTKPLLQEMKKLSQSFNQSLLEPTKPSTSTSPSTNSNQETDEDEEPQLNNRNSNIKEDYYQSEAWEKKITDTLESFSVPQPHQPHTQLQTQDNQQTQAQQQSFTSPTYTTNIMKMAFGSSIIWCFPSTVSQSTLFGRNGSNACTFIALLLSKFYFVNNSALALSPQLSLSLAWMNLMINSIILGNSTYDSILTAPGQYFSVEDAAPFLTKIAGNFDLEESLDLSIINENPTVPQSSLAFYLPRLTQENHLAGIVIMNGMTISIVGRGNKIIIMDSHLHNQFGALIAITTMDKVEELLFFMKQQLSPSFNLCSLTFIKF